MRWLDGITNSRSPPKPMSIESVMPSNHLIFCCPLFLLPSIFPSIRVFSDGKASACNAGDPGSIPGLGRFPWRRKWQSTPALLPGKSHARRSLICYSPWGHKESDTTERLHFSFPFASGSQTIGVLGGGY